MKQYPARRPRTILWHRNDENVLWKYGLPPVHWWNRDGRPGCTPVAKPSLAQWVLLAFRIVAPGIVPRLNFQPG